MPRGREEGGNRKDISVAPAPEQTLPNPPPSGAQSYLDLWMSTVFWKGITALLQGQEEGVMLVMDNGPEISSCSIIVVLDLIIL